MATRTPTRRPDWRNLAIAVVVPAAFFAVLEGTLALVGIEPVLFEEDPYVGFATRVPLYVGESGSDRMVTAPNKLRLFNPQRLSRSKPPGVYRIFCVGGSTTYGRPYDDRTSFCGWLRELLPAVDPSREWEVLNAGGVSYASYRTALLMEELVAYEPDLFIIYSGHNEFLEKRTYSGLIAMPRAVRGLGAVASRTRTYAAMRAGLRKLRPSPPAAATGTQTQLAAEVRTLLDGSIGPDAYHRDDTLREQVLDHYRFNLARMVDIARSVGARALLVTPASNLRHSSPFKSEESSGLAAAERRRWQSLLDRAELAKDEGRLDEALAAVDAALAIEPRYAHAHYLRAAVLDLLERYGDARLAFERARDEDVCPLRAPAPIPSIVAEVANVKNVPLVDFDAWVDREAPQGIPGAELFLDHVHPTIDAHRELALQLLRTLRSEGIVAPSTASTDAVVDRVRRRVEGGLDRDAHGRALLTLSKVLGWAGKLEEASRLAEQAVAASPGLPEAHYQAGLTAQLTDRLDLAIAHYRSSLELAPNAATTHGNLAAALEKSGSTLQAILHYRQAIALLGDQESAYKRQLTETLIKLGATPD